MDTIILKPENVDVSNLSFSEPKPLMVNGQNYMTQERMTENVHLLQRSTKN